MPTTILEDLGADFGVVGEGEFAFPWLLERARARPRGRSDAPISAASASNGGVADRRREPHQGARRRGHAPRGTSSTCPRYYERGGALNMQTQARLLLRVRLLQLSADRGHEGAHAHAERRRRRDRGAARASTASATASSSTTSSTCRSGTPRRSASEIVAQALDIEWSGYLNPKFVDEELVRLMAALGLQGRRVRHRLRRRDDDREPQEGIRRRTTCGTRASSATGTASSSRTA